MNYKILKRDGPATIGKIKSKDYEFPNIIYFDTERFKAPDYSDILIKKNIDYISKKKEINEEKYSRKKFKKPQK